MIDFVEMRLFVKDEYVISDRDSEQFLLSVDLLSLGLTVGARDVYIDEQGNTQHSVLYHPYDELPTSFTNVAFKLVHEGKIKPHVMIKCSPAKIMQGHNIFAQHTVGVSPVIFVHSAHVQQQRQCAGLFFSHSSSLFCLP